MSDTHRSPLLSSRLRLLLGVGIVTCLAAGVPEKDRRAWGARQTASLDPATNTFPGQRSSLLCRAPAATNRLVNPLDAMKAVGVKPLHATFDLPYARLIAAGHPECSVLFARMSRRGPGQMPQLATAIVDEQAVAVVREWIESFAPKETEVTARSQSHRCSPWLSG